MDRQITCFKGFGSMTADRPGYGWSPPAGKEVYTQGARRGIYRVTMKDGTSGTAWNDSDEPLGGDRDAMKFMAACAYSKRGRVRFGSQNQAANQSWMQEAA